MKRQTAAFRRALEDLVHTVSPWNHPSGGITDYTTTVDAASLSRLGVLLRDGGAALEYDPSTPENIYVTGVEDGQPVDYGILTLVQSTMQHFREADTINLTPRINTPQSGTCRLQKTGTYTLAQGEGGRYALSPSAEVGSGRFVAYAQINFTEDGLQKLTELLPKNAPPASVTIDTRRYVQLRP